MWHDTWTEVRSKGRRPTVHVEPCARDNVHKRRPWLYLYNLKNYKSRESLCPKAGRRRGRGRGRGQMVAAAVLILFIYR